MPPETIDRLGALLGTRVTVHTQTVNWMDFQYSESSDATREGILAGIRPAEIVLAEDTGEGRTEAVLPIGAWRYPDPEGLSDDEPFSIEHYVKAIKAGEKTFTLVDPRLQH